MADRPNPYVRKDPGDIIRSGDWNELQVRAREEVRSHRHTGDDEGTLIPRTGIKEKAIDGSRIDPAAEVNLKKLSISGDLKVSGKFTLGDMDDLLTRFKSLESDKLNRAGDTITGSLSIKQTLTVSGQVGIGTTASPKEPLEVNGRIQSGALTIGPWPGDPGNYVFFGTNALNQADAANYALLLGTAGVDLGVTLLNSSKNIRFRIGNGDKMVLTNDHIALMPSGNVGIGLLDPKAKLAVAGEFIRKVKMATGLGPEDATDNGQITSRVLTFTKYHADTAIRILYCDNLRVFGNDVAARWEIRVDSQSVPGGAIFQDKYGNSGNYHGPATILGYAVGISAGTHTIGVWVGPIPPRGICDAYTGWNNSRWTLEAQEVWL